MTTTTALPDRPPPSTASYILATFIVAACAGYFLGQASSIGLFSSPRSSSSSSSSSKSKSKSKNPSASKAKKSSWPNSYDVTVHPDSSDEELMTSLRGEKRVGDEEGSGSGSEDESEEQDEQEEEEEQGGLKTFEGNSEECKLVLVVRTDLGMGKGTYNPRYNFYTLYAPLSSLSKSIPPSNPPSALPFPPHHTTQLNPLFSPSS